MPDEQEHGIIHVGGDILRAQAKNVRSKSQGELLCTMLTDKLRELEGAGLAAPQIGIPYRVFVVEVRKNLLFPDREESPLYTVINPILEYLDNEENIDFEACFSVPGYLGMVSRRNKIKLSWTEPGGQSRQEIFSAYLARVFQHEMDHLNGLLYLDRMNDMSSFTTRENFMRKRIENECMTVRKIQR